MNFVRCSWCWNSFDLRTQLLQLAWIRTSAPSRSHFTMDVRFNFVSGDYVYCCQFVNDDLVAAGGSGTYSVQVIDKNTDKVNFSPKSELCKLWWFWSAAFFACSLLGRRRWRRESLARHSTSPWMVRRSRTEGVSTLCEQPSWCRNNPGRFHVKPFHSNWLYVTFWKILFEKCSTFVNSLRRRTDFKWVC